MAVPTSGKRWQELKPPLSASSLKGVQELGFESMTPVQSATIPYFLQNKDVAVEAVTGSGKTLAFVIPVIEILSGRKKQWTSSETGALIITPTRELATQIAGVVEHFLPPTMTQLLLIGGRDTQDDITAVNGPGAQVVVATPGRLVDLLGRPNCQLASSLKSLEVLVLDEADRLLELGFEQSINTALSYLPKQRRTGLFSATLTQDVKALIRAGMRNPVIITVKDKRHASDLAPTPSSLCNYYCVCSPEDKFTQLLAILEQFKEKKIIVFFATCASVSYFSALTKRLAPSMKVLALHGRMHKKRQKCFTEFSDSTDTVLMCTDVMARGVDFPHVDWVVQFDPPSSSKAFVHRCGRTARMGLEGQALVMLLESEVAYVNFLQLNQHITLQEFKVDLTLKGEGSVVDRARELAVREREVYEQGKRALVSFVHFYYKHECKLIFQAKDLDIVGLAKGYGLPHLPRMPELKGKDTSLFSPHTVPSSSIPFKDKRREKQRQLKLEQGGPVKRKQYSLSKAKVKHPAKQTTKRTRKRQRNEELTSEELDELTRDARLLKKFKAGKITKEELETQLDEYS